MLQIFYYCVLVIQIRGSFGEQVAVRAFAKADYIQNFSSFINSDPDIDQWVSLRSTKNYFHSAYDYFADLKLSNQTLSHLIDKFKIDFKFLSNNSSDLKTKRQTKSGIVGKYVSYDEVIKIFLFMKKKKKFFLDFTVDV